MDNPALGASGSDRQNVTLRSVAVGTQHDAVISKRSNIAANCNGPCAQITALASNRHAPADRDGALTIRRRLGTNAQRVSRARAGGATNADAILAIDRHVLTDTHPAFGGGRNVRACSKCIGCCSLGSHTDCQGIPGNRLSRARLVRRPSGEHLSRRETGLHFGAQYPLLRLGRQILQEVVDLLEVDRVIVTHAIGHVDNAALERRIAYRYGIRLGSHGSETERHRIGIRCATIHAKGHCAIRRRICSVADRNRVIALRARIAGDSDSTTPHGKRVATDRNGLRPRRVCDQSRLLRPQLRRQLR